MPGRGRNAGLAQLIAREGKVGRDGPFYDNYRPQLRFSADKHEISCTVRLAPPREKVEPGETAEVALRCTEPFHVFEKNKSFVAYEGGRKVGEGRLRDQPRWPACLDR
ncbi:MAG: hypothetical protein ACK4PH_15960 [Aquincola tertiaricarbonis]